MGNGEDSGDVWAKASAIADTIQPPRIQRSTFTVKSFSGLADGKTDDGAAIARAIYACTQTGGGRILLSPGVTLTGSIRLRSSIELPVPKGAPLKFIPDPARYLPPIHTRWEEDIALTGGSVIDQINSIVPRR